MHPHKLCQTFLCYTGPQTRGFHVFTEDSQDLGVCHPLFESRYACLLTSNAFDIECRLANTRGCEMKFNLAQSGPPKNLPFFSLAARNATCARIGCGQFRPFKGMASPSVGDGAVRTFFLIPFAEKDVKLQRRKIKVTDEDCRLEYSNTLHQISNANFKSVGNCLNREQSRILHATLNTAQKGPVNVGFGGQGFLRQLPIEPRFPHTLSKLFRNVMAHSWSVYPESHCGL